MIIIKLLGGLGNQMFQYAMGRAIAFQRNDIFKLDLSEFAQYELRKYTLSHLKIQESFASPMEIQEVLQQSKYHLLNNFEFLKNKLVPYYKNSLYLEQGFDYDPNVFNAPQNVIFSGYWQSEKYFRQIENIIREEFHLKEIPDEFNREMADLIHESNSISLHVRRGDYVTNPITRDYHGVCSLEYYVKAIQIIQEKTKNPVFFLFSDDIEWIKRHINIHHECHYITHNRTEKDYLDLWLMSQCKHHIIANSSFSWWGAWLGEYQEKKVIAPSKWFNDSTIPIKDRIPESWITI